MKPMQNDSWFPYDEEELKRGLAAERQKFEALNANITSIKERLDAMMLKLEGEVA